MAILRPVSELRILLAIDSGSTLKVHRDMDGHKDFMLHPLEGRSSPVEPDDVLALVENGLLDSNKKFPAATFWMTERGREAVAALTPYERDAVLHPKDIKHLSYQDFVRHPLWHWYDDDDGVVEPYYYSGYLEQTDFSPDVFVLCELALADGTRQLAVISVRIQTQTITVVQIPDEAGQSWALMASRQFEWGAARVKFAAIQSKPIEAVFPLRYETPYKFRDGTPLMGQIE